MKNMLLEIGGDPYYIVAENLAELCLAFVWKDKF
jgi:hypothetical protein